MYVSYPGQFSWLYESQISSQSHVKETFFAGCYKQKYASAHYFLVLWKFVQVINLANLPHRSGDKSSSEGWCNRTLMSMLLSCKALHTTDCISQAVLRERCCSSTALFLFHQVRGQRLRAAVPTLICMLGFMLALSRKRRSFEAAEKDFLEVKAAGHEGEREQGSILHERARRKNAGAGQPRHTFEHFRCRLSQTNPNPGSFLETKWMQRGCEIHKKGAGIGPCSSDAKSKQEETSDAKARGGFREEEI